MAAGKNPLTWSVHKRMLYFLMQKREFINCSFEFLVIFNKSNEYSKPCQVEPEK